MRLTSKTQHNRHFCDDLNGRAEGYPPVSRGFLAVGIFGTDDFSHNLLILTATQLLTPSIRAAQVAGLLYVWRNVVQVATSYPIGVLADRYGQRNIPVIGYALGVLTALAFAVSVLNVAPVAGIFFVAGLHVAISAVTVDSIASCTADCEIAQDHEPMSERRVPQACLGSRWKQVRRNRREN